MTDKSIKFFEVNFNGEKVNMASPKYENMIKEVVVKLVGNSGGPVSKYGVDYHIAWEDEDKLLCFEGKQDDFLYSLEVKNTDAIADLALEADTLIDLINSENVEFDIKWWFENDAFVTDDPGICEKDGKLTYEIKLTDLVSVEVMVFPERISDLFHENMGELEHLVAAGKYYLFAYKRA